MHITYITHVGFDAPNPNNQMAEVLFNDILDKGHQLHIIQGHTKGVTADLPKSLEGYNNLQCDTIIRKVVNKSHFIKRYLSDVNYYFRTLKYWRSIKTDLIYIQSGPTVVFLMILLKLFKRNAPIIYSIYDVFPGHAYDIGVIKSKFIYSALRLLQKPCYKIPKAITVLSEDMKNIVVVQGATADKVHVVPAWFDTNTNREVPLSENRFVKKYEIDTSKFYVQFAGTIGYVFNYNTIIEVASRLRDEEDIVFQMIGDGTTKAIFMDRAQQLNLTNIVFYPLQPIEIVPDVYSTCSMSIIPLMKGVIGNGVPSKAPILMTCKRLILTAVEAESIYAKEFKQYNMGLVSDVFDYDDLAKNILWAKNNQDKVAAMIDNAYAYASENYSSDVCIAKLYKIFNSITHLR